ncbi:hypothetical protein IV203_032174 [Nitzschia inconspicua]|uniref:Uncharacterized protein n=1 Tax=Nitzschia inconspicua TaxID=303405 RepID=A0A9K3Q3A6_9STRA|nr:hypothetical protein IV203_032174 [Nitzschia inconspicua]
MATTSQQFKTSEYFIPHDRSTTIRLHPICTKSTFSIQQCFILKVNTPNLDKLLQSGAYFQTANGIYSMCCLFSSPGVPTVHDLTTKPPNSTLSNALSTILDGHY